MLKREHSFSLGYPSAGCDANRNQVYLSLLHSVPRDLENSEGQGFKDKVCAIKTFKLLKTQRRRNIPRMSLTEIQNAIEQLSFEERAKLAAWFHAWKDDEWDEQMKRDIAQGKLDLVLHEVEDDIKAGRLRSEPDWR